MSLPKRITTVLAVAALLSGACLSRVGGGPDQNSNQDGDTDRPGSDTTTDEASNGGDDDSPPGDGTHATGAGVTCGALAPSDTVVVDSALPALPTLTGVQACVNGDALNVTFPPLDDAVDYRIYPLPADDAINVDGDGNVVIRNAVYRCAGTREALRMIEDPSANDNTAGGVTIVNGNVEGVNRTPADAQLGHVYTAPGDGRVPVYVIGKGDPGGDGGFNCGRPVFDSTRPKVYTTSASTRDTLIAHQHGRDDGIAFYVPASAGAGTKPVYEGNVGDDTLRWVDGAEKNARGNGTTIFNVLTSAGTDTAPLMRVHVAPYCTPQHDELVAGMARYKKARFEGDQPLTALRWSGLAADTVMVIEALSGGCPYQGHFSPVHAEAFDNVGPGPAIPQPAYLTVEDMRAASATSEVFINGQYDTSAMPRAIARTFVHVAPVAAPATLQFYDTFAAPMHPFSSAPSSAGSERFVSDTYDLTSYSNSRFIYGTALGELWLAYSDQWSDTNGKVRLTAKTPTSVVADSYLRVTTEVDVISTPRRYPQIIISDTEAPVQDNLPSGTTVIVQAKDMTPTRLQVQVCDHRTWDVNNQCPMLPTFADTFTSPAANPGELAGTDNTIKIDVYLSTSRIYLLVNDAPYSCTSFSATAEDGETYTPPSGQVSVTFGDALYHSGESFTVAGGPISGAMYQFHQAKMLKLTRRHFDNIGFVANQPAPAWDETRFPCVQ